MGEGKAIPYTQLCGEDQGGKCLLVIAFFPFIYPQLTPVRFTGQRCRCTICRRRVVDYTQSVSLFCNVGKPYHNGNQILRYVQMQSCGINTYRIYIYIYILHMKNFNISCIHITLIYTYILTLQPFSRSHRRTQNVTSVTLLRAM